MDVDESYRELTAALRSAEQRADRAERALAALSARVDQLVEVLVGRGALAESHRAMFDRLAERAAAAVPSRVRLRVYVDKYTTPNADVDCASLLPICQARCCALSFELTTQDLDEGVVMWEAATPYVIRHEHDGHCSHLDRQRGGCGVYAERPASCRSYDCRGDKRIWADFEKRIPAPLPDGLAVLQIRGR